MEEEKEEEEEEKEEEVEEEEEEEMENGEEGGRGIALDYRKHFLPLNHHRLLVSVSTSLKLSW